MSEHTVPPQALSHPTSIEDVGLDLGHLGRFQLISLAIAGMIPAIGIALGPFLMFALGGGPNAWISALFSMIVTSCVGFAVITFARRYVGAGSLYSYIGEAFGPWSRYAMAAGVLLCFVTGVAGAAASFSVFAASFFHGLGLESVTTRAGHLVLACLIIALAAAIASRGLDTSFAVVVLLTVVSIPLVALISIMSASRTGLDLGIQLDLTSAAFSWTGVFQGMAGGVAWILGFESCSALAAETRDPKRNVPIAVMAGPVALGLVYLIATFLQVPGLSVSMEAISAGSSPTAALAELGGLPGWISSVTDVVLAAAAICAVLGFINYGSRCLVALAVDDLLPARLTTLDLKRHSPVTAIAVLAGLCLLVIVSMPLMGPDFISAYNVLAQLLVFVWVPGYVLICAGAIRLTVRRGDVNKLVIPASLVGGGAMAWLYYNGVANPSVPAAGGIGALVLAGMALLAVLLRRNERRRRAAKVPRA